MQDGNPDPRVGGTYFADVEILMAIAFRLPNGFEISYNITTPVHPYIEDNTGDGNGKPYQQDTTRTSHMVRLQGIPGTPAANQMFDVEVCDAFTLTGPNNTQHLINCPASDSAQHSDAVAAIVDTVGAGLAETPEANKQTRCQHCVKYMLQIPGATSDPYMDPTHYAYGLITDCISFNGPPFGMPYVKESAPATSSDNPMQIDSDDNDAPQWHSVYGLVFNTPDIDNGISAGDVLRGAMSPQAECLDKTAYIDDPINPGNLIPPPPDPSLDLNVYVYFPLSSGGPWLGDATPANNTLMSDGSIRSTPGYNGIDMGPIWWIRQLGQNVNVWYWYVHPKQTGMAWSFFGSPPGTWYSLQKWGYDGWNYLDTLTVTWILASNYSMEPCGTVGTDTLVEAATGTPGNGFYVNQTTGQLTPFGTAGDIELAWAGLGVPDGNWGCSTSLIQSGTISILGGGIALASVTSGDNPSAGFTLPTLDYVFNTFYAPYGAFDLLGPPSTVVYAANSAFWKITGGPPKNIWELTGIPQPPLRDPSKPWNAAFNPYFDPTPDLAKQVVNKFVENWNATADSINSDMAGLGPPDGPKNWPKPMSGGVYEPNVGPETWSWVVPYGGDTVGTAVQFSNGWIPGVLPDAFDQGIASVPTIACDQLPNKDWNNLLVLTSQGENPPSPWGVTYVNNGSPNSSSPLNQQVFTGGL